MNTQIKNSEKCRSFRFKSVLMTVIAFLLAMNVQAQIPLSEKGIFVITDKKESIKLVVP